MQEWNLMDFPQEMFKRTYEVAEFQPKLVRLWKYYGKVIDRPKIIIKEYETVLRRYYRYKMKKRLQSSYLFGKEDPMVEICS